MNTCFICLEDRPILEKTPCSCNMFVHKKCFTELIKRQSDMECRICKQRYNINIAINRRCCNIALFKLIVECTLYCAIFSFCWFMPIYSNEGENEKLVPHPHDEVAFGLLILKLEPMSSSL